jgi:hypothetical protein
LKKLFYPLKWKFFQTKLKAAHIDATKQICNDIFQEILLRKYAIQKRIAELTAKKLKLNKFDRAELSHLPVLLQCLDDLSAAITQAHGKREKLLQETNVFS